MTQQSKSHQNHGRSDILKDANTRNNIFTKLLCVFLRPSLKKNPTQFCFIYNQTVRDNQIARQIPRVHCKCGVIVLHSNYLHCSVVKPRRTSHQLRARGRCKRKKVLDFKKVSQNPIPSRKLRWLAEKSTI